jgi:hypothetical protein
VVFTTPVLTRESLQVQAAVEKPPLIFVIVDLVEQGTPALFGAPKSARERRKGTIALLLQDSW